MVNYAGEMTAEMSCRYCEYGSVEHLLFWFVIVKVAGVDKLV